MSEVSGYDGPEPPVTRQELVAKAFDLPLELLESSHSDGCGCFPEQAQP